MPNFDLLHSCRKLAKYKYILFDVIRHRIYSVLREEQEDFC